jgi:2-polyprenyl-3-methyl-5-hydroxy-6-metoxy-1,4-benzoquinol methylase
MYDIKESVLKSLDGNNVELFPYLPYLLKDIWEIGSSSTHIIHLLESQAAARCQPEMRVLDLGCGKGAIAVPLAKQFGFRILGIDAVPEFVEDAREKAREWGVERLCHFEVGDIREYIEKCSSHDIIILGSIGTVLGNIEKTLGLLNKCLKPDGMIILDDAYIPEGSDFFHTSYLSEAQFMKQIRRSGFSIVDEAHYDSALISQSNREIYQHIRKRAQELIAIYPGLKYIFEDYLKTQRAENGVLENYVRCVLLLLEKIHNHHEN